MFLDDDEPAESHHTTNPVGDTEAHQPPPPKNKNSSTNNEFKNPLIELKWKEEVEQIYPNTSAIQPNLYGMISNRKLR